MKKRTKIINRILCFVCCLAILVCTAPISYAAGLMKLTIDDRDYTKIYTDTGALDLVHWTYDVSEDTLRLENFGTAQKPKPPIFAYPYSGSMSIELTGDNYIEATHEMAMIIIGHVTFKGTGTLNIKCLDTYAIYTDYTINIEESVSIKIDALAGITAAKGLNINTSGSVLINEEVDPVYDSDGTEYQLTRGKSLFSNGDIRINKGTVKLRGTNGIYTSAGNVFLSGGQTDVVITSTQRAIYIVGSENYLEWSANAVVTAGASAPGSPLYTAEEYTGQPYFHAAFSGLPRLNPPRAIYWDDTVIDELGTTNPVGRWSAVENAKEYVVRLYFINGATNELVKTFTVNDALSCNFGGHFTKYGEYIFSVQAVGESEKYLNSYESAKTTEKYYFSGEVESRFYITLPESNYYKIIPENGSTVVRYGENFVFTIEVDPAYSQSTLTVRAGVEHIAKVNGKYVLRNVTSNRAITIDELSVNRYKVTLPEHEAYTIYLLPDNSTDVTYGESCSFSIELSDIYMQSDIVVKANGEVLTPKYGIIYTIKDITMNYTVEITGLRRDKYDVTFRQLDNSLIATQTIGHGYTVGQQTAPDIGEGLTFRGWYYEDGTEFDYSTPVEQPITLYARYEAPKEGDCYLISTEEQLTWFRYEVNYGNTAINGRLMADISVNEGNYYLADGEPVFQTTADIWKPIGGYNFDTEDYVRFYEGDFDGNGHTLSGFYIKHDKMAAEASYLGIFGIVGAEGSVHDLNVVNSYFDGYSAIGSIVGLSYSPVRNCTSTAILNGVESTGGIVGEAHGDVSNCSFEGTVIVEQYTESATKPPIGGYYGAGIAGRLTGDATAVTSCIVSGKVSVYNGAGGIIGGSDVADLTLDRCKSEAEISATQNAGGFLGCAVGGESQLLNVTLTDCENSGEVFAVLNAGGFVGKGKVRAENCRNTGSVSSEMVAGGFVADGSLTVRLSINSGAVSAANLPGADVVTGTAGGFIAKGDLVAEYCYNIGEVSAAAVASGFGAGENSAAVNQCHNYAAVTAPETDAFAFGYAAVDIQNAYYCSELAASDNGVAANKEWFDCGYVALLLNRQTENNFWHQADDYPVFSSADKPGYVMTLTGDGSAQAPYIIENETQLRLVRILVNNEAGWSELNYKLGADISVSESQKANNFEKFGSMSNIFTGTFDGDGHTISGVNIYSTDNNIALFVGLSGTVKNLTLDNFNITGKKNVAAVVAQNGGTITNCTVKNSTVNGYENVGSVVGYNLGTVSFCRNYAAVNGTLTSGGVVGLHEDNVVESCFNYGNITGVDYSGVKSTEIGGVVGKSFAIVRYCGNIGSVSADTFAGGVVGVNYDRLLSLYNGGSVTATEDFGSITSLNDSEAEVERCFYVTGTAPNGFVVGTAQAAEQAYNGMTAYALNDNGRDKHWAQSGDHPSIAKQDGSDAVIYTVIYYSFDEFYYIAAASKGGCAITPPAPQVDGYNFLYWDKSFDNVTGHMSTTAVFDKNTTITFVPSAQVERFDSEYISVLCGFSPEAGVTVGQLDSLISNASNVIYMNFYEDEEYTDNDRLFTGMSINLYIEDGVKSDTLYVVIFGDVNGDGYADEKDAYIINMVCNEAIYIDELDFAQQLAADVNRDGVVDISDLEYMEQYLLIQNTINQSANP